MSAPHNDLPTALSLAGSAVDGQVVRALERAGLPGLRPRHGYVVQRLLSGPKTATEIAEALGVSQQAVSKTVKEMVALGYVQQACDPVDRRRRPVELSERGRQAVDVARRTRSSLARQLGTRVGEERLTVAHEVVAELLGLLGLDEPVRRRAVPPPDGTDPGGR
ncbi:MarR family winged helix-turn-helix transcriptional regulator [Nocardioides sp. MAHUQ-72]|uniref:MarR family winged helix-turn-helix transcriptional regulator n=1 Tax=unclassified Nocardioides TaxID=2615069 RepID=UPI003618139C